MLKKIILGGLFLALVGVLVAGALNRTAARSAETSGNQHGQTPAVAARGGRNGNTVATTREAAVAESQTVSGVVSSVDASRLEVTLSDGRLIEVGGRAWQLATAQSFTVNIGDSVTLHGFDENEVFQVSQIDNPQTGQTLSLRDATGRPMWAGRG